jgi:hypothetical protein
MALIEVHHVKKVTATIQLDEPVAIDTNRYAAFIHASADDVINKALEYVFAKDREFQKFIDTHTGNSVVPSLQIKESRAAGKTAKRSKIAAVPAAK